MKLSVETYVMNHRYGIEKAIDMIKTAGFDAVDYSFYWGGEDFLKEDDYAGHAKYVRNLLDKAGLECNQAHAPFNALQFGQNLDTDNFNYKEIVRAIDAASIMGAKSIIVHSLQTPADVDCFEYNVDFYKTLEPYAKKAGIKIAVENLFRHDAKCGCLRGRIHTAKELTEMINRLGDSFVVCVDVGHAGLCGIEPEDLISGLDGKILKALHIHDNEYHIDSHTLPGAGRFNWDNITSALGKIGYDGDFTFEIVSFLKSFDDGFLPEALQFAEKVGRMLINKI